MSTAMNTAQTSAPDVGILGELPPDLIVPFKDNPRTNFDDDEINALTVSIREHGLEEPLTVTYRDSVPTLVSGERRWRACKRAGLTMVPVRIVQVTDDDEHFERAVAANGHALLSPMENARAAERIWNLKKLEGTDDDTRRRYVAAKFAKGPEWVDRTRNYLRLPEDVQVLLDNSFRPKPGATYIHAATATELLKHFGEKPKRLSSLAERIAKARMSARRAFNFIKSSAAADAEKAAGRAVGTSAGSRAGAKKCKALLDAVKQLHTVAAGLGEMNGPQFHELVSILTTKERETLQGQVDLALRDLTTMKAFLAIK
jgi:ParB family chromosome partitioning protein